MKIKPSNDWDALYMLIGNIASSKYNNYDKLKLDLSRTLKVNREELPSSVVLLFNEIAIKNYSRNIHLHLLESTEFAKLRFDKWLMLSRAFGSLGYASLALVAREKAVLSIKNYPNTNQLETLYQMKLTIEENDLENFRKINSIYNTNKMKFIPYSIINRISNLHDVLKGVNSYSQNEYSIFLNNKRIAIVGPTVPETDLSREIDNFDIVVRTNFKKQEYVHQWLGSKTDISYYNNQDFKILSENLEEYQLINLDWICHKDSLNPVIQSTIKNNHIRSAMDFDSILFSGKLSKIPHILLDILSISRPRQLKIFNLNFNLYPNIYQTNYRKDSTNQNNYINNNFLNWSHDLITQKKIICVLFDNKLIDLDDSSRNILTLSDKKYVEIIDSFHDNTMRP
jgi:hypothetical protein